jgi:hypothetical protein
MHFIAANCELVIFDFDLCCRPFLSDPPDHIVQFLGHLVTLASSRELSVFLHRFEFDRLLYPHLRRPDLVAPTLRLLRHIGLSQDTDAEFIVALYSETGDPDVFVVCLRLLDVSLDIFAIFSDVVSIPSSNFDECCLFALTALRTGLDPSALVSSALFARLSRLVDADCPTSFVLFLRILSRVARDHSDAVLAFGPSFYIAALDGDRELPSLFCRRIPPVTRDGRHL